MSYRLKARAPLGAYGVSPMPTLNLTRAYTAKPGRAAQAAIVAVSACALLLVLALGTWVVRRQSAAADNAAAALAQVRDQQAEINKLLGDVAALRGANDLTRAELATLRDQRVEWTRPRAAQLQAAPAAATPAEPPRLPVIETALPAAPVVAPPVVAPPVVAAKPEHRHVGHHHARRSRKRLRTVVVDGVTYVRGREPHALSLPMH